jgi:hypothetical protein
MLEAIKFIFGFKSLASLERKMDKITRTETFGIEFNADISHLSNKEIRKIQDYFTGFLMSSDEATISTEIDFLYFNDVDKTLSKMLELLDMDKVSHVITGELQNGRSLIQDVLLKLEKIEKKLGG